MQQLTINNALYGRIIAQSGYSNIGPDHPLYQLDSYLESGFTVLSEKVQGPLVQLRFLVSDRGMGMFVETVVPMVRQALAFGATPVLELQSTAITVDGNSLLLWHFTVRYADETIRREYTRNQQFAYTFLKLLKENFVAREVERAYSHHHMFINKDSLTNVLRCTTSEMLAHVHGMMDPTEMDRFEGLFTAQNRTALLEQIHDYFIADLPTDYVDINKDFLNEALLSLKQNQ